jgi:hypothetical protein
LSHLKKGKIVDIPIFHIVAQSTKMFKLRSFRKIPQYPIRSKGADGSSSQYSC